MQDPSTIETLRRWALDARDNGDHIGVGPFRVVTPEPDVYVVNDETILHGDGELIRFLAARAGEGCWLRVIDHSRLGRYLEPLLAYLSEHFGKEIDQLTMAGDSCLARWEGDRMGGFECFDLVLDWLEANHKPEA